MEIVTDIHGIKYQMAVGEEVLYPGAILVQFKSLEFAEQFLKWLTVDPNDLSMRFSLERVELPALYEMLAVKMVEGALRFAKLP